MTVAELRKALDGISDDAIVNVSVTYSWDGKSGDAVGSEAIETDFDGPDRERATASSFLIIGETECSEMLRAAWTITGVDLREDQP